MLNNWTSVSHKWTRLTDFHYPKCPSSVTMLPYRTTGSSSPTRHPFVDASTRFIWWRLGAHARCRVRVALWPRPTCGWGAAGLVSGAAMRRCNSNSHSKCKQMRTRGNTKKRHTNIDKRAFSRMNTQRLSGRLPRRRPNKTAGTSKHETKQKKVAMPSCTKQRHKPAQHSRGTGWGLDETRGRAHVPYFIWNTRAECDSGCTNKRTTLWWHVSGRGVFCSLCCCRRCCCCCCHSAHRSQDRVRVLKCTHRRSASVSVVRVRVFRLSHINNGHQRFISNARLYYSVCQQQII